MGHVAKLARWEWFKLRRRLMPWALLLVALMFSQIFIWASFFSYRSMANSDVGFLLQYISDDGELVEVTCRDVMGGADVPGIPEEVVAQWRLDCEMIMRAHEQNMARTRASFTLPGSLTGAIGIAQGVGLILVAILASSNVGTDYGWGTLRTVLVRGTGRWQYLGGKLLLLVVLSGAALLIIVVAAAVSSLVAGALTGGVTSVNEAAPEWSEVPVALGKSWFALLPYLALAVFVTVYTTSTAAGMAFALAYYFLEQVVVLILSALFEWFEAVADFTLGRNIAAWMGEHGGLFFNGGSLSGEAPGMVHSFLVLSGYILVLAGLAFWRFQRRDVAGAGGT